MHRYWVHSDLFYIRGKLCRLVVMISLPLEKTYSLYIFMKFLNCNSNKKIFPSIIVIRKHEKYCYINQKTYGKNTKKKPLPHKCNYQSWPVIKLSNPWRPL